MRPIKIKYSLKIGKQIFDFYEFTQMIEFSAHDVDFYKRFNSFYG